MLSRIARPIALAALSTALSASTVVGAPERASGSGPVLGLAIDREAAARWTGDAPRDPGRRLLVRLAARWDEVETEPGVYDWSRIEPAVEALDQAGCRVMLVLGGGNRLYAAEGRPPSPEAGESLHAWTAFVRSAVRSFAGRVSVFEIGDEPAGSYDPAVYAFVLKTSALAVRAEARAAGATAWVAQGALDPSRFDFQRALWEADAAPYVDVLPVRFRIGEPPGPDVASTVAELLAEAAAHPPAPEVWALLEPVDAGSGSEFAVAAAAVRTLAASASAAIVAVGGPSAASSPGARWVRAVHDRLGVDHAPAPEGALSVVTPDGGLDPSFRVLGRFADQKTFATVVVYSAPLGAEPAGSQARLILDTVDVKAPRVIDPVSGADLQTGPADVPGSRRPALRILRADHPMLATWERAAVGGPGLDMGTEDLEVRTTRGLTAEEIIARYQAIQKEQDELIERWSARGRVDFHFKLAQGGSTVDVAIESNYFWERGGQLEWEQTDYYVNGNKVTWKNIPELPLVQPEKVVTVPLDLTLDRTYAYRLDGEDRVDGRPTYMLSFEPVDSKADASLYRGRVWIDKETFVRVKANVIQTNLEAPVVSNEETDLYRPVTLASGATVWMLSRIDGQQLWTVGGRNFVVRRELTFESFTVNPARPAFDESRRAAYASTHQMLRDTDEGFRYLERRPDGTRVVKQTVDTSQLFAAAGAFKDSSRESVVPLGGVNWFDYDFLGRDIQANVFFAGVVAFATLSDPALGSTRTDLTFDATAIGLRGQDKVFVAGTEDLTQRIKSRGQFASIRLGHPIGSFVKVSAVGRLEIRDFSSDSDGQDALRRSNEATGGALAFVLPPDHRVLGAGFDVEFNRKGYTIRAEYSVARRSTWAPWGLFDGSTGTFVSPEYDSAHRTYSRWGITAFKEWYLPKFQKLRAEVNVLDGADLDRFSRYEFSLFGEDRLNGFSGTGVRFDRGTIVRGGYSFNLFGAIRLDASIDTARVEDERAGGGFERFTGAGLSGNIIGPWKTVIQASYGRAIASDVPELEGEQEFLLVVLKLF